MNPATLAPPHHNHCRRKLQGEHAWALARRAGNNSEFAIELSSLFMQRMESLHSLAARLSALEE